MIAVDTNVLVAAHRRDHPGYAQAANAIKRLAEGRESWALPWPCVHEFLAIATHPRIFDPPSTIARALDQVDAWLESPTVVLISEGSEHRATLSRLLTAGSVTGPRVHDARIAALCLDHGVRALWTADRDFSRFPELATENPLIDS